MIGAIAIDDWKLSIFERRLKGAGFEIMDKSKLTEETLVLRVEYTPETFNRLHSVVRDCQAEADRLRRTN